MGQTGEIENYASTECYFNSTIPYKQKLLNKEDSKPCENEKFQKNGVLGVIPESKICSVYDPSEYWDLSQNSIL